MANLTITIDDALLRRARVRALEQGTSVNALLRDYLTAYAGSALEQERALADRHMPRRPGRTSPGSLRQRHREEATPAQTALTTSPTLGYMDFSFTPYFENKVLAKRPYITAGMCICVVQSPLGTQMQTDGETVRFWARVPELNGRVLRVVTLADHRTIHNAFPDRRFRP